MIFSSENPELLEAVTTKSESLHDNLKSVYVESQGDNPEVSYYIADPPENCHLTVKKCQFLTVKWQFSGGSAI